MTNQNLYVRLCIILAVIAVGVMLLYPPEKKLRLGLDLAGGTQLVYQVDVPEGQDAQTTIDQVIAVLRKRIDPNGVMNLIWRPMAGNRIEIQIPEATKDVKKLRAAYTEAHKALLRGNIAKRQLTDALRLQEPARSSRLDAIAGDDADRRAVFARLAQAYDELQKAREPKDKLADELSAADRELLMLSVDASEEDKKKIEDRKKQLIGSIEQAARAFNQAQQTYDELLGESLAGNVSEAEIKQVLSLPNRLPPKSRQKEGEEGKTLRQISVEALIARHPDQRTTIEDLIARYEAYEKVKGPIDDPNDLITLLQGSGVLEFRIAPAPGGIPDEDAYREQLEESGPTAGRDKPYRWMIVDDIETFTDQKGQRELLERDPEGFFRGSHRLIGQAYAADYYVLLGNTDDDAMTGSQEWKLDKAWPGMDQTGFPSVMFQLNTVGGHLMGELTGSHVNAPMAIVLDGRVISTPNVRERINGSGQISGGTGGFSQSELSYLIRTLNAGSLQGRLSERPISQKRYGPQFGEDNLRHGLEAAKDALVLVAIFMLFYYLFWGGVADFALVANMVIILGIMSLIQATWTLPGIAGIVLTIGMAVDANVLIFERIREETAAGVDIEKAINLGFEKAFSTIVDANVTTLITCVVLYYTASAEIKGFALTLGIGIGATLFTALYCSRALIDLYMSITRAKTMPMLPTIMPAIHRFLEPRISWTGKRRGFFTASLIIVVMGLGLTFSRGADMLDIEFRSGTQVAFELKEGAQGMTLAEARERLANVTDSESVPELKSATVISVGDMVDQKAKALSIAVLNEDSQQVSQAVKNAFADVLETEQPIAFAGQDADKVEKAPIYRIVKASLGESINRPEITENVGEFLGGVAVILEDMSPSASEEELTSRIERMRLMPQYEKLGFPRSRVIGLDLDAEGEGLRYRSAVVVTHDGSTNYVESPESFTSDNEGLAANEWRVVRDALRRDTSLESVSNFSSSISSTMKFQALQAMILSLAAVVAYIWLRFGSFRYGLAAIVALVHDVSISLGLLAASFYIFESTIGQFFQLTDFKINLAVVAALLTIVGYSLNDTIVVFDRIRENRGRRKDISEEIVNRSINQTISRTVITSGTTLIAVGTLYFFGGDGVHGFAFTLLIGVFVGTYSSIAIASPILLMTKRKVTTEIAAPATTS